MMAIATNTITTTATLIPTITRTDLPKGIATVSRDPDRSNTPSAPESADLSDLRLLQLADSAMPIGALAHSFGLESLAASGNLQVTHLPDFMRGYLEEAGAMEAAFCREAIRLAAGGDEMFSPARWLDLNYRLSAWKPARESRSGSAVLGRNFLHAVAALGNFPVIQLALQSARESAAQGPNQAIGLPPATIHHALAFGLVGGALGFAEDRAVLAYLHQCVASLVSACQRLLPLGQSQATRILWELKPTIIEAASRSAASSLDSICCFMPLLDWGGMEHPALATRLFIS
jgi:urease accessory protein